MRPPEPLGVQHQLEGFDCGYAALNRWLQQRALANERQAVSRTVVLCSDEGKAVIAYACLSAGAIVLAEVPGALRRNMPDPLPVVVLGRLAVDRRHQGQGQGLGRALVADALRRSLIARRLIGARALLVHATDAQAAAFYRSLGFRPSPLSASTLMLRLSEPTD
jgi:ribosomal protein S18 acetylase RimI-like enzyme